MRGSENDDDSGGREEDDDDGETLITFLPPSFLLPSPVFLSSLCSSFSHCIPPKIREGKVSKAAKDIPYHPAQDSIQVNGGGVRGLVQNCQGNVYEYRERSLFPSACNSVISGSVQ